jgi:redox-sensitive bicupin YhaK (pirin superfamily)
MQRSDEQGAAGRETAPQDTAPQDTAPQDTVLQTVELGFQWPTIDPFLFCVHHDDAYPAGDHRMAPPSGALAGRSLGSDFTPRDGWRMYHGRVVPGFPAHPHRGFETVTYVRRGLVDHSDSLGAAARYGAGDVQWLTAGAGIVHAEMFPLVDAAGPNHLELFQIWVNLPAAAKMAEPHFTMLWGEDLPRIVTKDDHGRRAEITVIAGALGDRVPGAPPPASYASRPDSDLAIWHLSLDAGAAVTLPPAAGERTARVVYVFAGAGATIGATAVGNATGSVVAAGVPTRVTAGEQPVEALVLQGRPIGEPVVQHGPFVMNDRAGIEQAFRDYRRTGFGGWPWPSDDPVHPRDAGRFARRPDGTLERPD